MRNITCHVSYGNLPHLFGQGTEGGSKEGEVKSQMRSSFLTSVFPSNNLYDTDFIKALKPARAQGDHRSIHPSIRDGRIDGCADRPTEGRPTDNVAIIRPLLLRDSP